LQWICQSNRVDTPLFRISHFPKGQGAFLKGASRTQFVNGIVFDLIPTIAFVGSDVDKKFPLFVPFLKQKARFFDTSYRKCLTSQP
jgi:hypothetical protein